MYEWDYHSHSYIFYLKIRGTIMSSKKDKFEPIKIHDLIYYRHPEFIPTDVRKKHKSEKQNAFNHLYKK